VEKLARVRSDDRLVVVDRDEAALNGLEAPNLRTVRADGVEYLVEHLHPDRAPAWIVPCLPVHLAFEWLKRRLGRLGRIVPVPDAFGQDLPNPMAADQGGLYLSYADFFCPDDCPEPADVCTHTGLPRRGTLFRDLADRTWPGFTMLVLRSRQLAPGLGGYRPLDLFALEDRARQTGGRLLLATACRCHGVLHGLEIG